jgi:hypothetical protein
MPALYDAVMDSEQEPGAPVILCRTCAHYALERFKVADRWGEGRRCTRGMRFAGERTECPYYLREPGSDDE